MVSNDSKDKGVEEVEKYETRDFGPLILVVEFNKEYDRSHSEMSVTL
jgi:hypothetical protein